MASFKHKLASFGIRKRKRPTHSSGSNSGSGSNSASRPRDLPDFLVIGCQKGGTTSLAKDLAAHPEVFIPSEKEVHYFSTNCHRGPEWYARHFAGRGSKRVCGEVTPYYLFHPRCAEWIHELLPEVKLVALLREPVARGVSHFFHARQRDLEPLSSLREALEAEDTRLRGADDELQRKGFCHFAHQKHSYSKRGLYAEQLDRYRQRFPAEQLLVLRSEDYFRDSAGVVRQVCEFLGLSPPPANARHGRHENRGNYDSSEVDPAVRELLRSRFADANRELAERYGIRWDDAGAGEAAASSAAPSQAFAESNRAPPAGPADADADREHAPKRRKKQEVDAAAEETQTGLSCLH